MDRPKGEIVKRTKSKERKLNILQAKAIEIKQEQLNTIAGLGAFSKIKILL